ncbi:hypothetical protein [Nostoc sp. FACHB-888]|uniref:ParM/StbA family protein n=1 Tax=Nostoc sp. FACHB-888 TaxID=2692842 RepID=UPI0016866000|nr:hypothetical protein [Nostoc sp. FACHB-888]MBD2247917.1 hypothetical protein [Nostoc sp. FACHB-888]
MTDLAVHTENANTGQKGTLTIIAGYDLGNSSIKFVSSDRQIRFPSYLENCYYRPTETPTEGYVEYLEGDALTKLDYKQWLSGFAAYDANPKNHLRVTDDATAKVNQSLKHLLAVLSYYPYKASIELVICASLHERGDLEDQLIEALTGRHVVKFGGKICPTEVKIHVLKVYDEGHAAIAAFAQNLNTSKQNVIVDIGNRTVIATLIGSKGHLANRKTFDNGVEELIRMISVNPDFKNRLVGEIAMPHLIRQGLESIEKPFWYGNQFSFQDVYQKELAPWVQKSLAPVFKFIHPWKINADACLITGGGSRLPSVSEALQAKGFVVTDNPVWANAIGLYQLANMIHLRSVNEQQ